MTIIIGTAMLENIRKYIDKFIASSNCSKRDAEQLLNHTKSKKPSLQLCRKIKAIMVKILCKVNQFDHHNQLITENIFAQNTYYKTLTSRP